MAPGRIACCLVLALASLPGSAQETGAEVFWDVRQRQQAGSAAQLILAGNPLMAAVLRHEGWRWQVWPEPEFIGDAVPELNADWLELIRDGTPMPDFRGKADDEKRLDQVAIYNIWTQAVVSAYNTPLDAFAKSAAENSHVTFAHLWSNPGEYRGKVVSVKGRLARVRKFDATPAAQKQGVRYVYEGWIFGPTKGSYPYWVLFPILPDGLKEAEAMDREVTFHGYFIKKMKYPAGDGSKFLEAPLLIGPTVTLVRDNVAPALTATVPMTVMAWVIVLIVGVTVGLVVLGWYFQRGDHALRARLAMLQAKRTNALLDHDVSDASSQAADENPLTF